MKVGPAAAVAALLLTNAAPAADLELGRYLAAECMTCHRAGAAAGAIPDIVGMDAQRLTQLLRAYREGALPNPVMQAVARRLNDQEIESIAAYLASLKRE